MKYSLFALLLFLSLFSCGGAAGEKVFYESCAVYAGSTDYQFKTAQGDLLLVRVSRDEADLFVKAPKGMTVTDSEGPPVMNEEMKGKPFILLRNANGDIYKIKKGW